MTLPLLYRISAAPVMPLWKKVESPRTPKTFFFCPEASKALDIPMAREKPPPMQMQVSIAVSGALAPSV